MTEPSDTREHLMLAAPIPGQVRIDPRPGDDRRATIIGRPDGARSGRGGWDYQWTDRHGRTGRCWASDESLLMEFPVAIMQVNSRNESSFRNALIRAVNTWCDYGDGTQGWSTDEADAILDLPEMKWIRQFLADTLNTDFLSPYQREITGEVPELVLQWADVPFDWADE